MSPGKIHNHLRSHKGLLSLELSSLDTIQICPENRTVAGNITTATTQQHILKVKITPPTGDQQVPVGKDLTVSGTSIDNATSNSQVSVIVNNVKPYQNSSATGTGGAADYSKWKFDITSKYTTIKPGQNKITAIRVYR